MKIMLLIFFIDSNDFIAPYLCTLFNHIVDNGIYPESWTTGVIVPIYKKGDKNNCSNYMGFTLVNIMTKIVSLLLRNRLNKWCEDETVFNSSQFGFRDGHSTFDAIFVLHSITQKVLSKKLDYGDYKRAFDTVNREALWEKLIKTGICCKMLNMVKSIYRSVQPCVRLSHSMSDFFDVTIGLTRIRLKSH